MMRIFKGKLWQVACITVLILILGLGGYWWYAVAAEDTVSADPVTLDSLDYDTMTISLNTGGNAVIYYSTNKKIWYEVDTSTITSTGNTQQVLYDISWLAYGKTVYFKGNVDDTLCTVNLPAMNKKFKVKFDKSDGTFDFDNTEGIEIVRWRKTTDYDWHYIWLDSNKEDSIVSGSSIAISSSTDDYYATYGAIGFVQSMENFYSEVSTLRAKAVKLIFQTVPTIWTVNDQGMPPSKEIKVSIPALKATPNIKVNINKLTVNTTVKQQWSVSRSALDTDWTSCSKNMKLSNLAPKAMSGEDEVIVYFRLAATASVTASKIATVSIPARAAAPTDPISISMVTPASIKKKAIAEVKFSDVPTEGYEYCIVKSGTLDESSASWKTIKKAKTLKFNENNLPAGSTICVRVKGVAQNINKKIDLKLPSLCYSATVPAYPMYSESKG